jgi:L,D-transpeptidase YcbB
LLLTSSTNYGCEYGKMKKLLFLIFAFNFLNHCFGQTTTDSIQQFISEEKNLKSLGVVYPSLVSRFYKEYGFHLAWMEKQHENRQVFFDDLKNAGDLGLNEASYHYKFIQSLRSGKESFNNWRDSLSADILITDAAIHFYAEVKNGNDKPALKYDGLNYNPEIESIPITIASFIKNGPLAELVSSLEPNSKEYLNAKKLLLHFNQTLSKPDFEEVVIRSTKVDSSNIPLRKKLFQLGFLTSIDIPVTSKALSNSLISAQKLFGLLSDGVLRNTVKDALNVPLDTRRKQLVAALNYIKWINEIKTNDQVVLLNIPSASLFVYSKGEKILESRVVVGKPSTPTPRLSSKIIEVIMYPYWNVPNKIATRELLPNIKRNIGFLTDNNFQVLNKQGKIVDPYKINWSSFGPSYFPYLIRQSTGCDNSLGIVKLNFYNPFSVYLHDTPGKGLFFLNKRYFSHGCMRVEKAMDLARLIVKDQVGLINRMEEEGCLKNQQPVILKADGPMNLFVIYSVAWYDNGGTISFFDDPYKISN